MQCVSGKSLGVSGKPALKYRVYEPSVAGTQATYVMDAINRNELTFRGDYVGKFEERLKSTLGSSHCVATMNGTVSLFALYKCLWKPGSRIAVPTMTYAATVSQIILAGLKPVYYDCDDNFQADIKAVEGLLQTWEIDGLVVAPLYADAPNLHYLSYLGYEHKVPVVVDAAEAFACKFRGKEVGAWGDAASYSFFANKVITTGEGGCVTTNIPDLAESVRLFCNQGTRGNYKHDVVGSNFRMTNLQAAIGCAQLEDLAAVVSRKKKIAKVYRTHLKFKSVVPRIEDSSEWMPLFRLNGPYYEEFRLHCEAKGVEVRPCFNPVHLMPGHEGETPYGSRMAESMVGRHFILPCHPGLTNDDLYEIIMIANEFKKGWR